MTGQVGNEFPHKHAGGYAVEPEGQLPQGVDLRFRKPGALLYQLQPAVADAERQRCHLARSQASICMGQRAHERPESIKFRAMGQVRSVDAHRVAYKEEKRNGGPIRIAPAQP